MSLRCHEGVWGSGCLVPRILKFGTFWKSVVSFTIRSYNPQRRSPRHALNGSLYGFDSWSELFRDEETLLPLPGIYNSCVFHPVGTVTRQQSIIIYELAKSLSSSSHLLRDFLSDLFPYIFPPKMFYALVTSPAMPHTTYTALHYTVFSRSL